MPVFGEKGNRRMEKGVEESKGWWYARFRMKWPENQTPEWHVDLLLAHKVITPVLNRYKTDIDLWRFHRRAARDEEGHQFSITFYSFPETAQQVFSALKSDKLLRRMKRAGVVTQDLYEDPARMIAPRLEDTSDGNWSPTMRKSWPYFIMGVCEMWLNLINELSEKTLTQKRPPLKNLLSSYRQINDAITDLWQREGGHSLLHHLNAIFGYEPVLVHEVNLRRY